METPKRWVAFDAGLHRAMTAGWQAEGIEKRSRQVRGNVNPSTRTRLPRANIPRSKWRWSFPVFDGKSGPCVGAREMEEGEFGIEADARVWVAA
eukprot:1744287-Rhodomonas_salina.2